MLTETENTQIDNQTTPVKMDGGERPYKRWILLATALIAVAALLISGIWSRVRARAALDTETAKAALTAVSVVTPKQTAPADKIILPGNVQPYISSPIYARTNG